MVGKGYADRILIEQEVREVLAGGLAELPLDGKRVLIITPDSTRTAPMGLFFRLFYEYLGDKVAALDYLVALGTHAPMTDEALHQLMGITAEEHRAKYPKVHIFNHHWNDPQTFTVIGNITAKEIHDLSDGLMSMDVPVTLNKKILEYDQLIICGPTFPHEVVGFSGGNKYFFPGISGPDVINFSHWLGAVITSYKVIGTKYTPVRRVIDRAASFITKPKYCFSMVVKGEELAGLYAGSPEEAYEAASDLSARLHVKYVDTPYKRVLSVMPKMYDDLWTAAKGMYKMEPAIADGGEVIIYAPHIDEISYTHGKIIDAVGYHVRDYFLKQWDKFKEYPWGVLAHSTHLRGIGEYDAETGIERPRIKVTLATGIPQERCLKVNLGYMNPAEINIEEWRGKEAEGILLVPKAGEMLYRLKTQKS
jgi:lactate racemase